MERAPFAPVAGIVLAGGRSRRMGGGDKCLLPLAGRPLLAHVVERLAPQVTALAIAANGDPGRFATFHLPVMADGVAGFAGPLAGILAGMEWAATALPEVRYVASVPGDGPFLPRDLVSRLAAAVAAGADIACAASRGRTHPVYALLPVTLRHALRTALVDEGMRQVEAWTARYRRAVVEFAALPVDPFFNINRPEDLAEAAALLVRAPG
ncbi:MAG: molybdenum cofactor guanylyltransferase MobA [Alphaproteobacteria bacterium]|nr:molybdenum cofactor guanylyltransferase MobA [Alphaproteobacteria bacterium]